MAVYVSENEGIIVTCRCGCDLGICIHKDVEGDYCYMSYINGNFYRDQEDKLCSVIKRKVKKIWAIIRNKDYYYSDIIMTKEDWEKFIRYVNSVELKERDAGDVSNW